MGSIAASALTAPPPADAAHSRFVQRVRRRYPVELGLLPSGVPDAAAIDALIDRLLARGRPLPSALRAARHVVLERLAMLDIEAGASLDDVTGTMTTLAECTLERALAQARAEADLVHGAPVNGAE